jgi:hypothetical protein
LSAKSEAGEGAEQQRCGWRSGCFVFWHVARGGVGDEPDGGQAHGQASGAEQGGQTIVDEREQDGNQGGEQAREGCGESHGAHGQGAVEQGQAHCTFKAADGREEQIVAAGQGQVGSKAQGEENEQRDEVAGGDDQQGWGAARAQAANEV